MPRESHVLLVLIIFVLAGCGPAHPVTPTRAPTATPIVTVEAPWALSTLSTVQAPAPTGTVTAVPPASTTAPVLSQPQPTSVPPTAIPATSAPSGGPVEPVIESFTASTEKVHPGETITLTWKTNVEWVSIRVALSTGRYGTWYDQPGQGSMTYTVPDYERNPFSIQVVIGPNEQPIYKEIAFSIICPDQWFVSNPPATCPQPVASGSGAIQRFEHGTMVWVGANDKIVILRDGYYWNQRDNTWDSSMPESDPSLVPPAGLFQPVRGFGKVWREANLLEDLGWALAPEVSAPVTYQCDTLYKRSVCLLQTPDGLLRLGVWGDWGPYTGP